MKKQSQNKPNLLNAQINVSSVLTKDYENVPLRRRAEFKPNQTRSEAEIPTGELLGILKPGTNFKPGATTGPLRNFYFILYSIYPI